MQEHVDQHRDDDADQAHEQERAEAGEIALRGVAVQAHGAERRRRDEEHPRDRRPGILQEDRRQRQAKQAGIDEEQRQRGADRQLVDAIAHKEHQAEGAEQQNDRQRSAEDGLPERGQPHDLPAGDPNGIAASRLVGEPGNDAGKRHAGAHVVVDANHIRAQPGIDRHLVGAIAGPRGRVIPIEVGHGKYPWVIPALRRALRSATADRVWRESSAKARCAPDGCDAIFPECYQLFTVFNGPATGSS